MELHPDHWSTTLKSHLEILGNYVLTTYQSYSNSQVIFIMHIHLMSTFITNPFYIPGQTHTNSSSSIHEYRIISHINTMALSLPTISCSLHAKNYPSSSFTTHTPSYSCIFIHLMPLYNNPIKSMPSIQEQRKYQTRAHSRPTPRSGWRVSLKRAPFA